MSTWNGIGTKYLGFGHRRPDGSHHATRWVVLFDLPVIPLSRHRLRVGATLHTMRGTASQSVTGYEVLDEGTMVVREVLTTLLVYWIVGPLIALGPVVLVLLAIGDAQLGFVAWLLILAACLTWVVAVPTTMGSASRKRLGLPKG
ncbi:hypothetical protein [Kitasatospora paranensis]|uniref:Uncharacterized protein n=1 Tax=Kitasatospora paranensis TaxID=258053 RepID=A0ABW2FQC1_9ACTN